MIGRLDSGCPLNRRRGILRGGSIQKRLEPAFENPAWQKHPASTSMALDADVGANADNRPVVPTAWVRFPESQHIADGEWHRL
jgi:hypothetical protein